LRLFLDACAVIYRIEDAVPANARLLERLAALRAGSAQIAVSRLSLLECRVRPLREGDADLLARYDEFFAAPDLRIVELDADVVEGATLIRARTGLRTPDALQAASSLSFDPHALFLTGDAAFRRVPGLRVELI
jgi:predicted nucleic acid-binding protein